MLQLILISLSVFFLHNRLQCLKLASHDSLVKKIWITLRADPRGEDLLMQVSSLLANIGLGRKALLGSLSHSLQHNKLECIVSDKLPSLIFVG